MQILADELETNSKIRVHAVNPGICRTHMRRVAFPGEDPHSVIEPAALSAGYLYLMGPDAAPHHGKCLNIQDD